MKLNKILITAGIFFGLYKIFPVLLDYQENKIEQLEERLDFLKQEFVPLKFHIVSLNPLKIKLRFYNIFSGEQIGNTLIFSFEKGQKPAFDFIVARITKEQFIAFPEKIFTEAIIPEKGLNIAKYYNSKGYPAIFLNKKLPETTQKAIQEIFSFILNNNTENIPKIYKAFGVMVQNKHTEINTTYKIISHVKGGVEIIKE